MRRSYLWGATLLLMLGLIGSVARAQEAAASSETCLACHGTMDGAPSVDPDAFAASKHSALMCGSCHTDIQEYPHPTSVAKVDCSQCHLIEQAAYRDSIHGKARAAGMTDAAACASCHGHAHTVIGKENPKSPVYHLNLPRTCGVCHSDPALAKKHHIPVSNAYQLYMDSIHGRAVMQSGLLVAANCSSCHGAHDIRPHTDPQARIHRDQIPTTCGTCHAGILNTFNDSIHANGHGANAKGMMKPVCTDCHQSHAIMLTQEEQWKLGIIEGCGNCHDSALETYRHSYHGKITSLGYTQVARCSDCHGSHNILPASNPKSTLSAANRQNTCAQCHEGVTANFVEYLPHADYTDHEHYPNLYYVYVGFTALLIFTFSFWGLHCLLWLIRMLIEWHRVGWKSLKPKEQPTTKYYWRFSLYHRATHVLVVISFLGLAATGLPLKFSQRPWAMWLAEWFGGFQVAGFIHRFCAIITFGYCFMHLGYLLWTVIRDRDTTIFWGPESLVPQPRDWHQFVAHLQWFLGRGPRPRFGRWTYWEKFDYWAVFWGVTIIGASGLVLWFPTFFAQFMPGWLINVATIIHSDEALLAVGFIFTVHFFNGHMRPEKFPLDPVIYTGRLTEEELMHDKPEQYAELKAAGRLHELEARPPERWLRNFAKIFGFTALTIGIILILLILLVW